MADELVIGLLHPGEMGAAIGRQLCERGRTVLWASSGRSQQTADRAAAAGLADVGTVPELVRRSQVVLSICPPHAAVEAARIVASAIADGAAADGALPGGADDGGDHPGRRGGDHRGHGAGVVVDANAVSPATTREVAGIITGSGAGFADGGIVGPPPSDGAGPRLYLSADPVDAADEVASLFAGTDVDARVVPGGAGAASAVKMAYAAWTKGTAALVLAVRALARAEGVDDALAAEWALSQPQLAGRLDVAGRSAVTKGWRWVAEMEEISAAFTAAGLPGGFHQAAAEVFRRSPRVPPRGDGLDADEVIDALLAGQAAHRSA
jgi:3-hydroxyisobutyrate dehydrogenase-like beta-hydroxyacid dehydrogenase